MVKFGLFLAGGGLLALLAGSIWAITAGADDWYDPDVRIGCTVAVGGALATFWGLVLALIAAAV